MLRSAFGENQDYFSRFNCFICALSQFVALGMMKQVRRSGFKSYFEEYTAPWGTHRVVYRGVGFCIKELILQVDGSTSLQRHLYRSELWYCMKGIGTGRLGRRRVTLWPGKMLYIPRNALHRLENGGDNSLVIWEVQFGKILREQDILRLEDKYGRATPPVMR